MAQNCLFDRPVAGLDATRQKDVVNENKREVQGGQLLALLLHELGLLDDIQQDRFKLERLDDEGGGALSVLLGEGGEYAFY